MIVEVIYSKNKVVKAKRYPYVGINGKLSVLFTSFDTGMVIEPDNEHEFGHHSTEWNEESFLSVESEVTIKIKPETQLS